MCHLIEFPSAFTGACRAGVDWFADDFAVGCEALPADGAMPFFGVFAHQNAPTASFGMFAATSAYRCESCPPWMSRNTQVRASHLLTPLSRMILYDWLAK